MNNLSLIQEIIVWSLPILFAVTVHEVAHGWMANKRGDRTALMLGRLTLNPIKHIDLIGTIIVPLTCLTFGGFVFGWAKPVPVDYRNLRSPKRDSALVAVAGPFSNLLMALIWASIAKIGELAFHEGYPNSIVFIYMGHAGITINLLLMILNLLPIPPLDGSRVVSSMLPPRMAMAYDAIEPYGFFILLFLIFTNVLSFILQPALQWSQMVIGSLFAF